MSWEGNLLGSTDTLSSCSSAGFKLEWSPQKILTSRMTSFLYGGSPAKASISLASWERDHPQVITQNHLRVGRFLPTGDPDLQNSKQFFESSVVFHSFKGCATFLYPLLYYSNAMWPFFWKNTTKRCRSFQPAMFYVDTMGSAFPKNLWV